MRRTMLMLLTGVALLAGGCSNLSRQQTFVAGGAVAGAALGGYTAGATGALLGAAVGGTGGYLSEMIWRPATPR
ncbi:MAG: hypothetical protein GC202_07280 [Alphaproteobacteria bacterium]|nr:hypothetical protein [Alphaproteobacteria bacterium]